MSEQQDNHGRCEPAYSLIKRLGGNMEVARAIQQHAVMDGGDRRTRAINPSTVSRWASPPEAWGTGGTIPVKYWPALVKIARSKGIELTIADLAGKVAEALAQSSSNDSEPPARAG